MKTIEELQIEIDGVVDDFNEKINTEHLPAGTPEGGQFAPKGGGDKGGALGKGVKTISIEEEERRIKTAGDAAAESAGQKAEARYVIFEPSRAVISVDTKPISDTETGWSLFDKQELKDGRKRDRLLVSGNRAQVDKRRNTLIRTAVTRAKNAAQQDERLLIDDERLGLF